MSITDSLKISEVERDTAISVIKRYEAKGIPFDLNKYLIAETSYPIHPSFKEDYNKAKMLIYSMKDRYSAFYDTFHKISAMLYIKEYASTCIPKSLRFLNKCKLSGNIEAFSNFYYEGGFLDRTFGQLIYPTINFRYLGVYFDLFYTPENLTDIISNQTSMDMFDKSTLRSDEDDIVEVIDYNGKCSY